ncbi:histidine phosphatase family protein [Paenibacillus selenitireducens]|uniref:Histidine phosphatase family protein n=1 Tax=Paenibacillus selenitireducens TaxID=1324314 RepID=A0A1T2XFK5_9BACL|nr:histidine phosphatase family protein [Paenibacillus selenitireducens]OPA78615.1 histidine phosphatase family protein [Paenibacillus selenitireducens]
MNTTVYMVRHAESPFVHGEEQTRGLSEEGFVEARKVADLLEGVALDGIVSSTYTRAIQTVQELADRKGLPILQFEELRERAIKGLDDKAPWEELVKAIEKSFVDLDYALEGGESSRQAQQRAIPIFEQLLQEYRGKQIAVGTHGNIMTILMQYYDHTLGFEFWSSTSMPDIYKMTFYNNQLESIERIWDVKKGV